MGGVQPSKSDLSPEQDNRAKDKMVETRILAKKLVIKFPVF